MSPMTERLFMKLSAFLQSGVLVVPLNKKAAAQGTKAFEVGLMDGRLKLFSSTLKFIV